MKTTISKIQDGTLTLRDKKLTTLVEENSFSDTIFYLFTAKMPDAKESRIFSAMLVSIIDHGMGTASAQATRYVMSAGNTVNASLAAGVLAIGDRHGGAIEKAMEQLIGIDDVTAFVQECLSKKKLIYGFGHKVYNEDPRAKTILDLCKELRYVSKHLDAVLAIEQEIEKQKGKKIPLNIDGLIAALLLSMGFSPEIGKGFFCIGRLPGLLAHALEQHKEGKLLRVSEEDIEFLRVENE